MVCNNNYVTGVTRGGGGSVAEGGPRVLVCDGAPEGLSTGLSGLEQIIGVFHMLRCKSGKAILNHLSEKIESKIQDFFIS